MAALGVVCTHPTKSVLVFFAFAPTLSDTPEVAQAWVVILQQAVERAVDISRRAK